LFIITRLVTVAKSPGAQGPSLIRRLGLIHPGLCAIKDLYYFENSFWLNKCEGITPAKTIVITIKVKISLPISAR